MDRRKFADQCVLIVVDKISNCWIKQLTNFPIRLNLNFLSNLSLSRSVSIVGWYGKKDSNVNTVRSPIPSHVGLFRYYFAKLFNLYFILHVYMNWKNNLWLILQSFYFSKWIIWINIYRGVSRRHGFPNFELCSPFLCRVIKDLCNVNGELFRNMHNFKILICSRDVYTK